MSDIRGLRNVDMHALNVRVGKSGKWEQFLPAKNWKGRKIQQVRQHLESAASKTEHRANMRAFISLLRREYGPEAGRTAETLLHDSMRQGKPLSGYLVERILDDTGAYKPGSSRSEIRKHNAAMAARFSHAFVSSSRFRNEFASEIRNAVADANLELGVQLASKDRLSPSQTKKLEQDLADAIRNSPKALTQKETFVLTKRMVRDMVYHEAEVKAGRTVAKPGVTNTLATAVQGAVSDLSVRRLSTRDAAASLMNMSLGLNSRRDWDQTRGKLNDPQQAARFEIDSLKARAKNMTTPQLRRVYANLNSAQMKGLQQAAAEQYAETAPSNAHPELKAATRDVQSIAFQMSNLSEAVKELLQERGEQIPETDVDQADVVHEAQMPSRSSRISPRIVSANGPSFVTSPSMVFSARWLRANPQTSAKWRNGSIASTKLAR